MSDEELKDEELNQEGPDTEHDVDGDRGFPTLNNKQGNGALKKVGFIFVGIVVIALVAITAWPSGESTQKNYNKSEHKTDTVSSRLPDSKKIASYRSDDTPAKPKASRQAKPAASGNGGLSKEEQRRQQLRERRQRAPVVAFGSNQGSSSSGPSDGHGGSYDAAAAKKAAAQRQEEILSQYGGNDDSSDGGFGFGGGSNSGARGSVSGNLGKPSVETVDARLLSDRNFLLTKGTFLDCALETAIDTTVSGFTSCRLTRNVYSESGKVLLLERGSRITGEYKSEQFKPGMNRLFVAWDRVVTPNGVAVDLASPGIDELGRSGHPGRVNHHFLQRFGAALMLSVMDDYVSYQIAKESGGGNQLNFNGTTKEASKLAEIMLKNNISIPPTLYKNQGEHIKIYVAKDIDFSDVYGLTE